MFCCDLWSPNDIDYCLQITLMNLYYILKPEPILLITDGLISCLRMNEKRMCSVTLCNYKSVSPESVVCASVSHSLPWFSTCMLMPEEAPYVVWTHLVPSLRACAWMSSAPSCVPLHHFMSASLSCRSWNHAAPLHTCLNASPIISHIDFPISRSLKEKIVQLLSSRGQSFTTLNKCRETEKAGHIKIGCGVVILNTSLGV